MRKRGNIKAAVWKAKDDEGNDDLYECTAAK